MNKTSETKDKKKIQQQKLIEKIKEDTQDMLLPTLKDKMEDTSNKIVEVLKSKGEDVNNIQIISLIAQGSTLETLRGGNISYTAYELKIAFNLYLDMINKINEYKTFPPTVESFCVFIGISRQAYNNWLVDPDREEVMQFIHSYLLGVLATGGLSGEMKEISAMYQQKVMGKVEMTTPVVIKHESTVNVDEINAQLNALKQGKIIDAEWEEKDE